jgi:hypothetical protein
VIDIRAADRAELLEHTSYFAAFTLLLAMVVVVQTAARFRAWLQRVELRESAVAEGSPVVAITGE